MAMNPRLLRPVPTAVAAEAFPHNPSNLVLVFDTSLEPANLTVSVPVNNVTGSPNVTINWGDGTTSTSTANGFVTKTYATSGVYVVQVSGSMTRLSFGTGASSVNNKSKLVRCLSFGNLGITQLNDGFRNCPNLIQVPASLPTTSSVTTLAACFMGCTAFNDARIAAWNTSTVTNMSNMFGDASSFNQNIGAWNTSAVTTIASMFRNAVAFNQPIGSWNTGNVTNMQSLFQTSGGLGGARFNQPIGSWNTSQVGNMSSMFFNANDFSQDISTWDIRRVGTMASMFTAGSLWGTANYNAALTAWAALPELVELSRPITAFEASVNSHTRVTSVAHGLPNGGSVVISGTTNYNGLYTVADITLDTFLILNKPFVSNDATGTVTPARERILNFSAGTNKYSAGTPQTSRGVLTSTYGWIITDGGLA